MWWVDYKSFDFQLSAAASALLIYFHAFFAGWLGYVFIFLILTYTLPLFVTTLRPVRRHHL